MEIIWIISAGFGLICFIGGFCLVVKNNWVYPKLKINTGCIFDEIEYRQTVNKYFLKAQCAYFLGINLLKVSMVLLTITFVFIFKLTLLNIPF